MSTHPSETHCHTPGGATPHLEPFRVRKRLILSSPLRWHRFCQSPSLLKDGHHMKQQSRVTNVLAHQREGVPRGEGYGLAETHTGG